jgi:outer membrane protein
MKYQLNKKYTIPVLSLLLLSGQLRAQEIRDTLTLGTIVETIIKNNPAVKQAENKISGSLWKEQLAKTTYLPNVYASAGVGRLYPLSAFDFTLPNIETGEMVTTHIQMVPDFTMDFGLKLNQMVYDFGKEHNYLGLQQTATGVTLLGVEELKQKLALVAAGYFYGFLYFQSAIDIKNDEINTLKQHLDFVEKRQRTGSATQYEVLSTQVRISSSETQLADLQASEQVLLSHLNRLMGQSYKDFSVKSEDVKAVLPLVLDSIYDFALTHRYEMLIAEKNKSAAEWNYKIEQSKTNPTLSFIGGTGFKNGYIPEINKLKFNYIAGLNLNVPIFDGNRKNISRQIASLGINDSELEIENLHQVINDELRENLASLDLARKKIDQFTIQLEQANKAYDHAKTNYEAGVITNLDLLDAANALSQSRLMLLKAHIDFDLYLIKVKAATGEKLF